MVRRGRRNKSPLPSAETEQACHLSNVRKSSAARICAQAIAGALQKRVEMGQSAKTGPEHAVVIACIVRGSSHIQDGIRAETAFPQSRHAFHLQCLVNRDLLNKSSFIGSPKNPEEREKLRSTYSARSDCCRTARSLRAGRKRRAMSWRFTWRECA